MKKRKYLKLRGEDTMVTIIAISMIGLLLTSFIGQAVLQSSNSELQRLKSKIEFYKYLINHLNYLNYVTKSNEFNEKIIEYRKILDSLYKRIQELKEEEM